MRRSRERIRHAADKEWPREENRDRGWTVKAGSGTLRGRPPAVSLLHNRRARHYVCFLTNVRGNCMENGLGAHSFHLRGFHNSRLLKTHYYGRDLEYFHADLLSFHILRDIREKAVTQSTESGVRLYLGVTQPAVTLRRSTTFVIDPFRRHSPRRRDIKRRSLLTPTKLCNRSVHSTAGSPYLNTAPVSTHVTHILRRLYKMTFYHLERPGTLSIGNDVGKLNAISSVGYRQTLTDIEAETLSVVFSDSHNSRPTPVYHGCGEVRRGKETEYVRKQEPRASRVATSRQAKALPVAASHWDNRYLGTRERLLCGKYILNEEQESSTTRIVQHDHCEMRDFGAQKPDLAGGKEGRLTGPRRHVVRIRCTLAFTRRRGVAGATVSSVPVQMHHNTSSPQHTATGIKYNFGRETDIAAARTDSDPYTHALAVYLATRYNSSIVCSGPRSLQSTKPLLSPANNTMTDLTFTEAAIPRTFMWVLNAYYCHSGNEYRIIKGPLKLMFTCRLVSVTTDRGSYNSLGLIM
ncbi:hypothetical protein J6590_025352 [Homalodisca vitripennis]|nr:hypothetical protein J6590_025352 [Homalodisca vitripennis]